MKNLGYQLNCCITISRNVNLVMCDVVWFNDTDAVFTPASIHNDQSKPQIVLLCRTVFSNEFEALKY